MPRAGGLRVSAETARDYEALGRLIRQHVRGDYILAAANCPEVYFLYGLHPPTKDFLGFSSDLGSGTTDDVLKAIQTHDVSLVVLNHVDYMFVQPLPDDLHLALERDFPEHAQIESFEVRWKQ
jgi:hypothetical protein